MDEKQLLLSFLSGGFCFWMFLDAVGRRAGWLWPLVICLAGPWGALAYLVCVKLLATRFGQAVLERLGVRPEGNQVEAGVARSEPVPALQPTAPGSSRQTQSEAGHSGNEAAKLLELADQLEASAAYDEALRHYRRALQPFLLQHADSAAPSSNAPYPSGTGSTWARALHGAARCEAELGQLPRALELYEGLMRVEPRFRQYSAALEYAEVLHRSGQAQDAVDLLSGLVEETGRINHRLALAHYLSLLGRTERAKIELRQVVALHAAAPKSEQPRSAKWYRLAVAKLKALDVEGSASVSG